MHPNRLAAKRFTLALLLSLAASPVLSETTTADKLATPSKVAETTPAAAEPAPKEESLPEECSKLAAGLVACRQTGGWKQSICEKGVKMQYNCPLPLEKLPL